jgi:hypothetical protein
MKTTPPIISFTPLPPTAQDKRDRVLRADVKIDTSTEAGAALARALDDERSGADVSFRRDRHR